MNGRHLFYGTLVATACFITGLLVAQDKAAAPEWQYKIVDMRELKIRPDGTDAPFEKRWADHIAKEGAGGWELVTYTSERFAIYKRRAP
jgi:hypothetical protein